MDAYSVIKAWRLGYAVRYVSDTEYWYDHNDQTFGPFPTIDDAAYAALIEHDLESQHA